jgi:hypothetical protein
MKTAAQWLADMKLRPCVTESDLLVIIRQIQQDALEKPCPNCGGKKWVASAIGEIACQTCNP